MASKTDQQLTDISRFKVIPLSQLKRATWNYKTDEPEMSKHLQENLRRNGQIENLIVRQVGKNNYEVVNGNHRIDDMSAIGMTHAICYDLGKITTTEAKRIAIETNETRFTSDQVNLAKILQELTQEYETTDLLKTLPYSEDELNGYLKLIDWNWQSLAKTGEDSDRIETRIVIMISVDDESGFREKLTSFVKKYPSARIID